MATETFGIFDPAIKGTQVRHVREEEAVKKLLAIVAIAVSLAACSLPIHATKTAAPAPPSSHCADVMATAVTQGSVKGILKCLAPSVISNLKLKTDDDFSTYIFNEYMAFEFGAGGFPPFVMNHGCGAYLPSKLDRFYNVPFFEKDGDVVVYGYAVKIDPSFDPTAPTYSLLMIGEDKNGLVLTYANLNNSKTECPTGVSGVASAARTA